VSIAARGLGVHSSVDPASVVVVDSDGLNAVCGDRRGGDEYAAACRLVSQPERCTWTALLRRARVDGTPSRRPAAARGPARTAAATHADQRRGHRTQPRTTRRTDAADLLGLRWLGMDLADRRREQPSSRACSDHDRRRRSGRCPSRGLSSAPCPRSGSLSSAGCRRGRSPARPGR
jgi:hypothetical protein